MITASEVLAQLTDLLADAELVRADADQWRTFIGLAGPRGYGPRLTPCCWPWCGRANGPALRRG